MQEVSARRIRVTNFRVWEFQARCAIRYSNIRVSKKSNFLLSRRLEYRKLDLLSESESF